MLEHNGDIHTLRVGDIRPTLPRNYVIYEILNSEYGFKGDVVDALCHALDSDATGRRFYSREWVAVVDRGNVVIAPITEDLYRQIMEFSHGPGKYIFSTGDGSKPMTYTCIYIAFNKRLEKLGITDKTFHSFRAFVDTTLSMENINESVIQKMIGHKDRKMTEHYLHLESGELRLTRDVQQKIEKGMA